MSLLPLTQPGQHLFYLLCTLGFDRRFRSLKHIFCWKTKQVKIHCSIALNLETHKPS